MIFFITGNGSITNFPFVPTIKIITTTGRWNLLSQDMDINAGRYQDGTPMDELGRETFSYTLEVASGRPSAGERAGHSQVSIWRDWRQTGASQWQSLRIRPRPDGKPIPISKAEPLTATVQAWCTESGFAADQIGLIVPTSLCAGQVAQMIAERLNSGALASGHGVDRFVALPHTEGCGVSGGENQQHLTRTVAGHVQHPFVREALLLEHGCEMTHNDLMRRELAENGVSPERFGYASIQLDGGIENVTRRVEKWFGDALRSPSRPERTKAPLAKLAVAMLSFGKIPARTAEALARIAAAIVAGGGTAVIPANATLLEQGSFRAALGWGCAPPPSLEYGQFAKQLGMHVMDTPTYHAVETLTGLGGSGAQLMLAHIEQTPLQGHPMIPLLQISAIGSAATHFEPDLDAVLDSECSSVSELQEQIIHLMCATASGDYRPRCRIEGNVDFQLTRGLLGVSL